MSDDFDLPKGDLMKGKKGVFLGVANKNSIAWGIASQLAAQGAELAFTYQGEALERRVRPLAESIGVKALISADVTDDASMDAAFAELERLFGKIKSGLAKTKNVFTGVFDLPFEGLPGFADDLLVGGDGALGRHAERVCLQTHVGGELALALRLAVETNRPVEVLVAHVVGELGGRFAGLGHGARVELASAVGGADIGANDALQMDFHRAVAEPFLEGVGGLDDEPFVQVANAVAVEGREAEALGDAERLGGVGAGVADHFEGRAAAKRDNTGRGARRTGGLGHDEILSRFHLGSDWVLDRRPLGCGRPEPA